MDVRCAAQVEPEVEHDGTVPVWWLVPPGQLADATAGGSLELVSEFEVAPGGAVAPHQHPTHEFYYVLSGRGDMTVGDETRPVGPGDLVRIPPDTVHSLATVPRGEAVRCFCFAVAVAGAGPVDYS